MSSRDRARTGRRRTRSTSRVAVLVATGVVLASVLAGHSSATTSVSATADGVVPEGTTVHDDVPAVTRLDPDLLAALRRAAADAAEDGVELVVNSGWRSADYQQRLLDEAVAEHGSREEAARWVATPATSSHVSGDAVDIGSVGAAWLADHGASYGLCQVYANEPWHYELRPDAAVVGCPARYADPTEDPRLR